MEALRTWICPLCGSEAVKRGGLWYCVKEGCPKHIKGFKGWVRYYREDLKSAVAPMSPNFVDSLLRYNPYAHRDRFYRERNEKLLRFVEGKKYRRVMEFAGATGLLAEMFLDRHPETEQYHLSDYSPLSCNLAREFLEGREDVEVRVLDIVKDINAVEWGRYDLVASTSLEHLPEGADLKILRRLRGGTDLLWSLCYECARTHPHLYKSAGYIRSRFNKLMFIERLEKYPPVYILYGHRIYGGYKYDYLRKTEIRSRRLMEALKPHLRKGEAVLDVCCGYSPLAKQLIDLGHSVVGFDYREDVIDHLRRTAPRGEWHMCNYADFKAEPFTVLLLLGMDAEPHSKQRFQKWLSALLDAHKPNLIFIEAIKPPSQWAVRLYERIEGIAFECDYTVSSRGGFDSGMEKAAIRRYTLMRKGK